MAGTRVRSFVFTHKGSRESQLKLYSRSKESARKIMDKILKKPDDWIMEDLK